MEQIEYLEKLSVSEFFSYIKSLNEKQITELINNPYLKYLREYKFRFLFFSLELEQAKLLLSNKILYNKVLNLPANSHCQNIFDVLQKSKIDILKLIIESDYIIEHKDKVLKFVKELKIEDLNNLLKQIDFSKISLFSNKTELYNYITNKFPNVDNDIFEIFYCKVKDKSLNILKIFRINNYKEFIIFSKFGVLVEIEDSLDEITFKNGFVIPINEVLNGKPKYIIKLMQLLSQKGKSKEEDLLIASLKLYYVFGFDNSKKIIEDKFSKMTDSALERINEFEFKDSRREFRTKNQHFFYRYQMIDEIINGLSNNTDTIFKNLLYEPKEEDVLKLKAEFKQICDNYSSDELVFQIKQKIAKTISIREDKYKAKQLEKLKSKTFNSISLNAELICDLLKDVDLMKVIESNEQTKLSTFLLGNTKVNNDCLFRLIVNRYALGLEDNLSILINEFKYIDTVAQKSNMSTNSILDVIDILKIKLYELKPNEEDIYLSSISRLINSVEFRDKSDVNVVKETFSLHVKRKEKVYSSIPSVKGKTKYYSYEVAPFDSEYLLTAGLDAKNCFRIGGFGEDFFKYCLTSPNAVVVYLEDNDGNKHICPIVRSGNAIHCNGIDPEVKDEFKKYAIDALSQCYCDIIKTTFKNTKENIEVGTITDLHMKEYFKTYKYPSYDLQCVLPLDESCYTDFNKKEIKHYVIANSKSYKENKYYISKDKYFQKRDNNYEFEINDEFDSENISLIVNSITYSAIDYMNIPQKEKNRRKRFFKPFDVKNFKYIIGNKDWYIAIDEQFNTISTILPYDKRALIDYLNSYGKVAQMFEKIIGDKVDRKNI